MEEFTVTLVAGGGNNSDPGGNGGNSMHIASFLEIRNGDFTSKIRGGGGGGGGGGHGDGGGGGHGSVKRCSGYFCGAVRKNVKRMVVKAAKAAMEEKEKGKDTNGLEMLNKLTQSWQRRWSGR